MPHMTLEYAANVTVPNVPQLLRRLHHVLRDVGDMAIGNCKSRAVMHSDTFIGDGDNEDEGFAHLDVRFLEGRTPERQRAVGEALHQVLVEALGPSHPRIQVTVEVREIARDRYFKYPAGTLNTP